MSVPPPAKLLRPLPPGRTLEQVWHHYQVEKRLAAALKAADRQGRRRLYATMYDELFAAVPDHPRLTLRATEETTRRVNAAKLAVLGPWLSPDAVVVEFAAGDCRFALGLAGKVRQVIAVDISDQRAPGTPQPANFELVLYDGYTLGGIVAGSVDVVFSDQLLEHLHPDEVQAHFAIVFALLRPGGVYVVRTPQALTGPHDVSRYFSDEPEGFHLHEWHFGELRRALTQAGFARCRAGWNARALVLPVPAAAFGVLGAALQRLPRPLARGIARVAMPMLLLVAQK